MSTFEVLLLLLNVHVFTHNSASFEIEFRIFKERKKERERNFQKQYTCIDLQNIKQEHQNMSYVKDMVCFTLFVCIVMKIFPLEILFYLQIFDK